MICSKHKKTLNNSSAFYNFRQNLGIVLTRQSVRSCKHTFRLRIYVRQEILFSSEQWSVYVIKFRAFQLKNNKVVFERINVLYPSKEELLWA